MVAFRDILQRLFPYGVFRAGEAVYLTFDDGPIPEVTPKVLEILERYNVKATFFMVGENIDKYPHIFEMVVKGGHAIGNHTYNHIKGWRYSTASYLTNVEMCDEAIERHVSLPDHRPQLMRPPYGRATLFQRRMLHLMGYRLIFWDVLTRDYNPKRTPEAMLRQIKRQTRPGSIINFHDSVKSNERMLEVLPQAIEWLLSKGYKLEVIG